MLTPRKEARKEILTPNSDGQWPLSFTVNDEPHYLEVEPTATLLYVLRERLGMKGTKGACLEGRCGSCTVLMDGTPVNGCLLLAPQAHGKEVTTVEGLADGVLLDGVQRAFVEAGAVQCGYCTPGFLLAIRAFLDRRPGATEAEVRAGVVGNICRCTGYTKILEAALRAAEEGRL